MVLKLYFGNNVFVYKDIDKTFFRTHSYGGMKYLQFDVSIKHNLYKYMAEETRLEYDNQYYLIKGIHERKTAGICTVNAELDLTGLESKIYISKTWTTETFSAFATDILSGTGWSISNAALITKRTTTEAKDDTPRKLLDRCSNTTSYGVCFEYDTKNKVITCINPESNIEPSGVYFTDELNLTELTLKGSSSSLVTKLYPIGKDGLTIASVNGGKDYIENYTYTDKVVCAVWRDERYTNAQSLKDDGVAKLASLAYPERAYTCRVINLAKTNPDVYRNILSFLLYDVVTLVDRIRGTRINHRIVELKEYPANHALDTVSLSTVAARISGTISRLNGKLSELNAQQQQDRTTVKEMKQDLDNTVLHVDDLGEAIQDIPEDVQSAWNSINKKIQFTDGELRVYDTANTQSQQLRLKVNENGAQYYRSGNFVGNIRTEQSGENHVGLVFDLNYAGDYFAFVQKESANDNSYHTVLCFSRTDTVYTEYGLHLGCDFYGHDNTLHDVCLDNVSVVYNGQSQTAYTGNIKVMIDDNGGYTYLRVSNGLIVGLGAQAAT